MNPPRLLALGLPALTLAFAAPLAIAEENVVQTGAYQASVAQEQLRAQTRRLKADMERMLEEFRQNPAATEEVALTEATIKQLEGLSDKDMAAVVLAFRGASRSDKPDEAAQKAVAASRDAKAIQITLTRLADKLALYQDENSIDLRLAALIRRQLANQRQSKYLFDGTVPSWELKKESDVAIAEQESIKAEIGNFLETLQRLATNSASTGRATFAAVYNAGAAAQLSPSSDSALALVTAKDFPNAVVAEGKVVGALQSMLLALNSSKSLEERLRAAETKMRTLSSKEEILARTTTRSSYGQQRVVIRKQQEIADQRTILEKELAQLNPLTNPLLAQTAQTMESIDTALQKERDYINKPEKKLELVNTQNALAKNFADIADLLKKQADAVAAANGGSSGQSPSAASDPTRQSIAKAAAAVSKAITQLDMAREMLGNNGNADAAKAQMDAAQGNIAEAEKQAGDAGSAVPEGVGESLDKADQNIGKGEELAGQGGGENRMKAGWSLGEAEQNARNALAGLQQAMNAMNSQGQQQAGMQAGQPNGQNQDGGGSGAGWGQPGNQGYETTSFSALAKISEKDREALSMLQREKSPPEYNAMVQQYLKNLAEGTAPAQ